MAFGHLNKRCKDGSRRFYEDEIRSVEVTSAGLQIPLLSLQEPGRAYGEIPSRGWPVARWRAC
jgi:hypothetical protein